MTVWNKHIQFFVDFDFFTNGMISVPCRNPKKESKIVAKVVATRYRKPFLYVANMVATTIKSCDQQL